VSPVELYDKQEDEVFDKVFEWGFEKEAKKHKAQNKRRDTIIAKSYKILSKAESTKTTQSPKK